eukprot:9186193-Pyramimonas_sp.AAC.1
MTKAAKPLHQAAHRLRRNSLDVYTFADECVQFLISSKSELARVLEQERVWYLEKCAQDIQISADARMPRQQARQ